MHAGEAGAPDRLAGKMPSNEATAPLEILPVSRASQMGGAHAAPRTMTVPTLFAPQLAGCRVGEEVRLDSEEAGHVRALRLAPGSEVALVDGVGHRWLARLKSPDRGSAVCVLRRAVVVPPALPIRLAFGVGNKDRTLWLIEKSVELGAAVLEPVEFMRSGSVADAARSPGYWRRARRRAVSALKQSGGNWLPRIQPVVSLDEWLDRPIDPGGLCLLADGTAERGFSAHLNGWVGQSEAVLLVGPEGGMEAHENDACREAGFLAGRLGTNTLRFETAAVAALALVVERVAGAGAADPADGADGKGGEG
jgi:16S rRNA (uracil1498-N3)-methyltransferase